MTYEASSLLSYLRNPRLASGVDSPAVTKNDVATASDSGIAGFYVNGNERSLGFDLRNNLLRFAESKQSVIDPSLFTHFESNDGVVVVTSVH